MIYDPSVHPSLTKALGDLAYGSCKFYHKKLRHEINPIDNFFFFFEMPA
jgi:hypothetical protein